MTDFYYSNVNNAWTGINTESIKIFCLAQILRIYKDIENNMFWILSKIIQWTVLMYKPHHRNGLKFLMTEEKETINYD